MADIELFLDSRDRFFKRTLLSSGVSLLLAAASRLPSWEVASPVEWLLGTVNVAFVPVFGPIVIFGCYCFTMLALGEVVALHREISDKPDTGTLERVIIDNSGVVSPRNGSGRDRVANYVIRFWTFVVPLIAYTILFITYLDFARPSREDSLKPRFETHRQRVADILLGIGGWGSFRPMTPSVYDNLQKRAEATDKKEEIERLRRVAELSPYIHAPLQAWGYVLGLFLMIYMAGDELLGRLWTYTAYIWQRFYTWAGAVSWRTRKTTETESPLDRKERRPVTPEVPGSSAVDSAKLT